MEMRTDFSGSQTSGLGGTYKGSSCLDRGWLCLRSPALRRSRFLSHVHPGLEHCVTTQAVIVRPAVIISFILTLEQSGGQGGRVPRLGARDWIWELQGAGIITIDQKSGGLSWELLVPAHTVTPNVAAAPRAGDGDPLARGPGHGRSLSQHSLGPGSWKGKRQRW